MAAWDQKAVAYDIMMVRGCPFECTFCIHNFTRKATKGLGTYVRRRSVDHVMARAARGDARSARTCGPSRSATTSSRPPRPWLEEFCARYKAEIGLPFVMYSFPRMVDDDRIALMRDAGLWVDDHGHPVRARSASGATATSARRRSEEIIEACNVLARHGVVRNLDFIGDNPYETDADRDETVDLLCRLPKPFYFNYFSLTYFPGVDLTERALRDGHIAPDDVEDVAQKGYHLWGGSLHEPATAPRTCVWDVAYTMGALGFPKGVVLRMLRSRAFRGNVHRVAAAMRRLQEASRWKMRRQDERLGRPNLLAMYAENTVRDFSPGSLDVVHPNFDNSPFSAPPRPLEGAA